MPPAVLAVDIGNSRIKLGQFDDCPSDRLPEPVRTLEISTAEWRAEEIAAWLAAGPAGELAWWIGSVRRPTQSRLVEWLKQNRQADQVHVLTAKDLPLQVRLEEPHRAGIDRLTGAVAANRLRRAKHPAVIIHVGTALTVNLVSSDGAFLGGAILPGIGMSARALNEFTDLLPLVPMSELVDPPSALGTSTIEALRSGLYWGAVGAMRELTARLSAGASAEADVFLTGGAAPAVAGLLGDRARYVQHLVLAGIAIAANSPTS